MKKVLVALAMIMGLGTSVAFAGTSAQHATVEDVQQVPQDEFAKIEVKDVPQVIVNALAKDYEGGTIKEAFVAEKSEGKVYKVVVVAQDSKEVTVLLNEKGEVVK